MKNYLISCENKSRNIKRWINVVLEKNIVKEVKRMNYVKSYKKNDLWKIKKNEEKMLLLIDCNDIEKFTKIFEWIIWSKIFIIKQEKNEK